ncbi:purine-nucleoside phosphorylase [Arenicella xantha]|uniref:Purine nucleoside phosphorylase n=1 Tax=Arenicella xantha TaxID=644221 RepID=A0A395JPD7_9GAMM|nr:purine-nucleoside phosphorylase [Arenicella xantha]RBP53469.1 purine-nucleoside phosphorylase [Arenicella xantha]
MSNPNSAALHLLVEQAASHIKPLLEAPLDTAIVLGTGLSSLSLPGYHDVVSIKYDDIPGMPTSTAPSHDGELRIISNGQQTVALCAGRQHLYEGYSAQQVSTMTYVLRALGAKTLIITNASGGLNADFSPGDVMLIKDHMNLTGHNPLVGQDETLGIRFPDMSRPYDLSLRQKITAIASAQKITVHQGVYAGVLGPSLETSAERRMLRVMGADAVGMSTVLEVIAAVHCGLNVLGLAAITNLALGDENQAPDTLEDVLENAAVAASKMTVLLQKLLA